MQGQSMTVIDFDIAARAEKRKRDAMSSRLLLLKLRKHHYEYAPDEMKAKWVPSPIVGDPIINHLLKTFEEMPAPDAFELRKVKSSVQAIMTLTARYYKIAIDDILGPRRIPKIVRARKVAMYLALEHTTETLSMISRFFRRDHSTVHYARTDVAKKVGTDKLLALQVTAIRKQLEATWDTPEVEEVKRFRKKLLLTNSRWDVQSEVMLIQGVKAGKSWNEIGADLGVSAAAACNKYTRLQAAKQAFEAAGADA